MLFRLLCADESETTRLGIDALCKSHGCLVDRFARNIDELNSALRDEHFDVLITDMRLGRVNMMEYVGSLMEQAKDFRVILFTGVTSPTLVAQAVSYGFYDVVFKRGSAMKLVQSLKSLENGRPSVSSPLRRFQEFMKRRDFLIRQSAELAFTKREVQVLVQLAFGLSNKEIASVLDIGLETVKEHVQNLLRKLKLSDRTAAAVWALRHDVPTMTIHSNDLV